MFRNVDLDHFVVNYSRTDRDDVPHFLLSISYGGAETEKCVSPSARQIIAPKVLCWYLTKFCKYDSERFVPVEINVIYKMMFGTNELKFCFFNSMASTGSAMLVVSGVMGTYFITGNFCFSNELLKQEAMKNLSQFGVIDRLYLDATLYDLKADLKTIDNICYTMASIIFDTPKSQKVVIMSKPGLEFLLVRVMLIMEEKGHLDICHVDKNTYQLIEQTGYSRLFTTCVKKGAEAKVFVDSNLTEIRRSFGVFHDFVMIKLVPRRIWASDVKSYLKGKHAHVFMILPHSTKEQCERLIWEIKPKACYHIVSKPPAEEFIFPQQSNGKVSPCDLQMDPFNPNSTSHNAKVQINHVSNPINNPSNTTSVNVHKIVTKRRSSSNHIKSLATKSKLQKISTPLINMSSLPSTSKLQSSVNHISPSNLQKTSNSFNNMNSLPSTSKLESFMSPVSPPKLQKTPNSKCKSQSSVNHISAQPSTSKLENNDHLQNDSIIVSCHNLVSLSKNSIKTKNVRKDKVKNQLPNVSEVSNNLMGTPESFKNCSVNSVGNQVSTESGTSIKSEPDLQETQKDPLSLETETEECSDINFCSTLGTTDNSVSSDDKSVISQIKCKPISKNCSGVKQVLKKSPIKDNSSVIFSNRVQIQPKNLDGESNICKNKKTNSDKIKVIDKKFLTVSRLIKIKSPNHNNSNPKAKDILKNNETKEYSQTLPVAFEIKSKLQNINLKGSSKEKNLKSLCSNKTLLVSSPIQKTKVENANANSKDTSKSLLKKKKNYDPSSHLVSGCNQIESKNMNTPASVRHKGNSTGDELHSSNASHSQTDNTDANDEPDLKKSYSGNGITPKLCDINAKIAPVCNDVGLAPSTSKKFPATVSCSSILTTNQSTNINTSDAHTLLKPQSNKNIPENMVNGIQIELSHPSNLDTSVNKQSFNTSFTIDESTPMILDHVQIETEFQNNIDKSQQPLLISLAGDKYSPLVAKLPIIPTAKNGDIEEASKPALKKRKVISSHASSEHVKIEGKKFITSASAQSYENFTLIQTSNNTTSTNIKRNLKRSLPGDDIAAKVCEVLQVKPTDNKSVLERNISEKSQPIKDCTTVVAIDKSNLKKIQIIPNTSQLECANQNGTTDEKLSPIISKDLQIEPPNPNSNADKISLEQKKISDPGSQIISVRVGNKLRTLDLSKINFTGDTSIVAVKTDNRAADAKSLRVVKKNCGTAPAILGEDILIKPANITIDAKSSFKKNFSIDTSSPIVLYQVQIKPEFENISNRCKQPLLIGLAPIKPTIQNKGLKQVPKPVPEQIQIINDSSSQIDSGSVKIESNNIKTQTIPNNTPTIDKKNRKKATSKKSIPIVTLNIQMGNKAIDEIKKHDIEKSHHSDETTAKFLTKPVSTDNNIALKPIASEKIRASVNCLSNPSEIVAPTKKAIAAVDLLNAHKYHTIDSGALQLLRKIQLIDEIDSELTNGKNGVVEKEFKNNKNGSKRSLLISPAGDKCPSLVLCKPIIRNGHPKKASRSVLKPKRVNDSSGQTVSGLVETEPKNHVCTQPENNENPIQIAALDTQVETRIMDANAQHIMSPSIDIVPNEIEADLANDNISDKNNQIAPTHEIIPKVCKEIEVENNNLNVERSTSKKLNAVENCSSSISEKIVPGNLSPNSVILNSHILKHGVEIEPKNIHSSPQLKNGYASSELLQVIALDTQVENRTIDANAQHISLSSDICQKPTSEEINPEVCEEVEITCVGVSLEPSTSKKLDLIENLLPSNLSVNSVAVDDHILKQKNVFDTSSQIVSDHDKIEPKNHIRVYPEEKNDYPSKQIQIVALDTQVENQTRDANTDQIVKNSLPGDEITAYVYEAKKANHLSNENNQIAPIDEITTEVCEEIEFGTTCNNLNLEPSTKKLPSIENYSPILSENVSTNQNTTLAADNEILKKKKLAGVEIESNNKLYMCDKLVKIVASDNQIENVTTDRNGTHDTMKCHAGDETTPIVSDEIQVKTCNNYLDIEPIKSKKLYATENFSSATSENIVHTNQSTTTVELEPKNLKIQVRLEPEKDCIAYKPITHMENKTRDVNAKHIVNNSLSDNEITQIKEDKTDYLLDKNDQLSKREIISKFCSTSQLKKLHTAENFPSVPSENIVLTNLSTTPAVIENHIENHTKLENLSRYVSPEPKKDCAGDKPIQIPLDNQNKNMTMDENAHRIANENHSGDEIALNLSDADQANDNYFDENNHNEITTKVYEEMEVKTYDILNVKLNAPKELYLTKNRSSILSENAELAKRSVYSVIVDNQKQTDSASSQIVSGHFESFNTYASPQQEDYTGDKCIQVDVLDTRIVNKNFSIDEINQITPSKQNSIENINANILKEIHPTDESTPMILSITEDKLNASLIQVKSLTPNEDPKITLKPVLEERKFNEPNCQIVPSFIEIEHQISPTGPKSKNISSEAEPSVVIALDTEYEKRTTKCYADDETLPKISQTSENLSPVLDEDVQIKSKNHNNYFKRINLIDAFTPINLEQAQIEPTFQNNSTPLSNQTEVPTSQTVSGFVQQETKNLLNSYASFYSNKNCTGDISISNITPAKTTAGLNIKPDVKKTVKPAMNSLLQVKISELLQVTKDCSSVLSEKIVPTDPSTAEVGIDKDFMKKCLPVNKNAQIECINQNINAGISTEEYASKEIYPAETTPMVLEDNQPKLQNYSRPIPNQTDAKDPRSQIVENDRKTQITHASTPSNTDSTLDNENKSRTTDADIKLDLKKSHPGSSKVCDNVKNIPTVNFEFQPISRILQRTEDCNSILSENILHKNQSKPRPDEDIFELSDSDDENSLMECSNHHMASPQIDFDDENDLEDSDEESGSYDISYQTCLDHIHCSCTFEESKPTLFNLEYHDKSNILYPDDRIGEFDKFSSCSSQSAQIYCDDDLSIINYRRIQPYRKPKHIFKFKKFLLDKLFKDIKLKHTLMKRQIFLRHQSSKYSSCSSISSLASTTQEVKKVNSPRCVFANNQDKSDSGSEDDVIYVKTIITPKPYQFSPESPESTFKTQCLSMAAIKMLSFSPLTNYKILYAYELANACIMERMIEEARVDMSLNNPVAKIDIFNNLQRRRKILKCTNHIKSKQISDSGTKGLNIDTTSTINIETSKLSDSEDEFYGFTPEEIQKTTQNYNFVSPSINKSSIPHLINNLPLKKPYKYLLSSLSPINRSVFLKKILGEPGFDVFDPKLSTKKGDNAFNNKTKKNKSKCLTLRKLSDKKILPLRKTNITSHQNKTKPIVTNIYNIRKNKTSFGRFGTRNITEHHRYKDFIVDYKIKSPGRAKLNTKSKNKRNSKDTQEIPSSTSHCKNTKVSIKKKLIKNAKLNVNKPAKDSKHSKEVSEENVISCDRREKIEKDINIKSCSFSELKLDVKEEVTSCDEMNYKEKIDFYVKNPNKVPVKDLIDLANKRYKRKHDYDDNDDSNETITINLPGGIYFKIVSPENVLDTELRTNNFNQDSSYDLLLPKKFHSVLSEEDAVSRICSSPKVVLKQIYSLPIMKSEFKESNKIYT